MHPQSAPMRSGSGSGIDEPAKSNDATSPSGNPKSTDAKDADRKLDTPLADILPSKYQNVDVCELFPDFRPQKVLRFSRLFGPGKPTSLSQTWRHVRKRLRKRNQSRDQKTTNTGGSDSPSDTEEPRNRGFSLHYAAEPTPADCMSDDEDKLLGDFNSEDVRPEGPDNGENSDQKPKLADWRYGPAQIWYDMLEVPDSGEGFNYGFKTKVATSLSQPQIKDERRVKSPGDDDEEPSIADDAWENDVVWDGNDIKDEVLQKLNSKTYAEGWLPPSGSRTPGAFSQPEKTSMPVGNSSGSSSGISNNAIESNLFNFSQI